MALIGLDALLLLPRTVGDDGRVVWDVHTEISSIPDNATYSGLLGSVGRRIYSGCVYQMCLPVCIYYYIAS